MLTEKDYCDYETCVALREVGCRIQTEWYIHQPSYERGSCYLCFGIPRETSVLDECDYIPRLSLYEAQKWLREEHNLHLEITYSPSCWTGKIYDLKEWDYIKGFTFFESFEDTLHTLIKEAVKILKENETILR